MIKMIITAMGKNALSRKANGKMITLFKNDPFVIFQSTGNSREETNPDAFSALTAKSSDKIPAVFFEATFPIVATSSIK